jgi:hypothetical protein
MADKVTAATAWIGYADDLNMSSVTQHSVPCILTQDQHDDRISTCSDFIESAHKAGTFLNEIITGDKI